jgi:hypothetical protein
MIFYQSIVQIQQQTFSSELLIKGFHPYLITITTLLLHLSL